MKTIKKHLKTLLFISLAAGLFFSCNNPAAPVATSATYNEPTLPESVGTDPFKGHTYRNVMPNSSQNYYSEYAFGNDNILTNSDGNNGTQTGGKKFQYSYNANTKELNLKILQVYTTDIRNDSSNWYNYSQYVALCKSWTHSDYTGYQQRHSNAFQTMTETEFNQTIQKMLDNAKTQFEKITVYKAEEDSSQNLKLRTTNYYKSVPSEIPCANETLIFSNNSSINLCNLYIYSTSSNSSNVKGSISKSTSLFAITNITSNTISAVQATSVSSIGNGYTPVSGGQQLQMSYTLALGNDNNLVLTLTAADTTTTTWFTSQFSSTSLTLSTSTGYMTYTKQ